jgi:hypothetical protein
MRLQDYPRPPDDNGIGVHWSGGNPNAIGAGELRRRWLPILQRMGVKWVKFLHDGGLEFAEMLLAAGIMPIVRLYREKPNSRDRAKAVLGPREIAYLQQYVALGVRYFEFNNEPDVHGEWDDGQVPPDAADYVARAAIRDMETILAHGGYPAVPATAIGNRWDLIGKIIEHGGRHLFDEPVWIAVHNYDLNHPLDYPSDDVNQTGRPLTAAEYERPGMDAWQGRRWGYRSREFVNEHRRTGANPGHTVHDDPSCFRAYERFGDLCLRHLGRHLPILSTENGPIVGEDDDPRYPTTTMAIHAEKVVEIARIMMGTSERYPAAPPYYFCTAFWLMGNAVLGGRGWEAHAWFSPTWPEGRLPAVDALAALPKTPRPLPQDEEPPPVEPPPIAENSVIAGIVHGHPHTRVILRSPRLSTETTTDAAGAYRFTGLPAGVYRVAVPGTGLVRTDLRVDGYSQLRVDLGEPAPSPPEPPPTPPAPEPSPAPPSAWQFTIGDDGPSPGFGVVRVSVEGKVGLPVHIGAVGWAGFTQLTGSKAEYGPYFCEFAPLGAGRYTITPADLGVQAEVLVDGRRVLRVVFTPAAAPAPVPGESVIEGRVRNGATAQVTLTDAAGNARVQVLGADERFRFADLTAGTYHLGVALPTGGGEVLGQEVTVDGRNTVTLDLTLPATGPTVWRAVVEDGGPGPGFGIVRVRIDDHAGLPVRIGTEGWEGIVRTIGEKPEYGPFVCEFAPLGLGTYVVEPQGLGLRAEVRLTEARVVWVTFRQEQAPAPAPTPEPAPEPTPEPTLEAHYLLVGALPRDRRTLLALLRYVGRFGPVVGEAAEEAAAYRHVTLLGDTKSIPAAQEARLRAAGCRVERLAGADVAAILEARLEAGQPF